jgi:hypothetical protein
MREVAPDAQSNVLPEQGRTLVLLFDQSIAPEEMPAARRIALAAVDAMGPGDLAAVLHVGMARPQNFTADRSLLRRAIDQTFVGLGADDAEPRGECLCGICKLEAIEHAADVLRASGTRHGELFFIGTAIRFQAPVRFRGPDGVSMPDCAFPLKLARERLFLAVDTAGVVVHSLDPGGLRTPMARRGASLDLKVLPERTGGRAVMFTNEPEAHVAALLAESASYYVLGVERPPARTNARPQSVDISVKRKNVKVVAQRKYASAALSPVRMTGGDPSDPPATLVRALATVWPAQSIPLVMSAAAVAGPGSSQTVVAVTVGVAEAAPRDGVVPDIAPARSLSVLAGAWDRNGQPIVTHTQEVSATAVPLAQRGHDPSFEYEVVSRLGLRPGLHEIRVAVEDHASGETGSVYTTVDVPDFSKDRLSLSGLVVSATPAPPLAPADAFSDVLPVVPTAQREFTRASRVAAFVRAYQGGNGAMSDVTMTATLLGVSETPIVHETTTLAASRFGNARSADYMINVPVTDLAPGPYLLTLQATLGDKQVTRHMRFEMK